MITKQADNPHVTFCQNASHPHLVHISIGTGMDSYSITPERAEELAGELIAAAIAAHDARR